jgi:hypothetical protein
VARVGALTALALAVLATALAAAQGLATEPRLPGTASSGVYPVLQQMPELGLRAIRERDAGVGVYPPLRRPAKLVFPSPAAMDRARRWAQSREGHVSFAVADRTGVTGLRRDDPFPSASLVKAMLLVAFLDRIDRGGRSLTRQDSLHLGAMIRVSDNDSATAVFHSIGPAELRTLARRTGMRSFAVGASWSEARVTAADQAIFFLNLDRLLAPRRRAYARNLLSGVEPQQSWGIPQAARPGWRVFFKGGWRPAGHGQLVHQAALMERGPRRVAIAVLTEGNPSEEYGHRTIRGIALRLLRRVAAEPPSPPPVIPGRLTPLDALSGYQAPEPRRLRRFSS